MIDRARQLVRASTGIVAFSGAGLSAESGVPTFRDPDTSGFWVEYDPQKLASPEGFHADPELVINWYNDRRRGVVRVEPNPAHRALAARPDIVNVTQNIDDLLHRAGAEDVVQLHGTLAADRCDARCGYTETIDLREPEPLRHCPMCGAYMRPDVVWFGEMLPAAEWERAERACLTCDLMLVVGTAAEVYPATGLIGLARSGGAKIIVINTNPSGASAVADIELIGPAGQLLPPLLADTPG
jgi:NAD-dependent deacetylase